MLLLEVNIAVDLRRANVMILIYYLAKLIPMLSRRWSWSRSRSSPCGRW